MNTTDEKVIACTLSSPELVSRRERLQKLTADHLQSHELDRGRLKLRYRSAAEQELSAVVELERSCCAFLSFKLSSKYEAVELEILSPEGFEDAASWLFAQFLPADALPASKSGCCSTCG